MTASHSANNDRPVAGVSAEGQLRWRGGQRTKKTLFVVAFHLEVAVIMPSRKKAKGKARKAAKEAKAKEEESQAAVEMAANQGQEELIEAQLQRLIIDAVSPKRCRHGCPSPSLSADEKKMFKDFINAYIDVFFSTNKDVGQGLATAYEATKDEYPDVYDSKLETVVSLLLARGTQCILDGENSQACTYAFLASHFEDLVVCLYQTTTTAKSTNPTELGRADDHTLVSYYRKRIPCGCLDEKYKEVKSVKKMGLCRNPNCSLPDYGRVERSKMFSCARCGDVNYCSVECQREDWKRHRENCKKTAEKKGRVQC